MKLKPHRAVYAWNIIHDFAYETGVQTQFGLPEKKYVKPYEASEPDPEMQKALGDMLLKDPTQGLKPGVMPTRDGVVPIRSLMPSSQADAWEHRIAEQVAYHNSDDRGFANFPTPPMEKVDLSDSQYAELIKRFQREGITERSLQDNGVTEGKSLNWSALVARAQEFGEGQQFSYYAL